MNRFLVLLTFVIVAFFSEAQTTILPTPVYQNLNDGYLMFPESGLTVQKGTLNELEFKFLASQFQLKGIHLKEIDRDDPTISFSPLSTNSPESYSISVGEKIAIGYSTDAGRFYGLMSLLQLVETHGEDTFRFPKLEIKDAPKFEWRGLHLDVSRHFFTVPEIERFLELMALYKFNTFHWHLTDDQGWRIEIKQYPKLTEIGGFRDSTVIGHYSDTPRKYEHKKYGGFYSQDEIRQVVQYAKALHINVVPEIEMPGHSRAALAAYPELSCTGEQQGVPGLWGVFDDIYCSKEASIEFLQNVLDEVLELFPSEYIHIGGDEAPKTRWNECEKCQKVMEENHLHDAHELQSYFIKRMDEYLTRKGRKLIGWDEILEGGLSPNAAVMSWRGEFGGVEAAKQGHPVVMSPTSYCYFDYYQSSHDSEPLAIGGFLPLEKVYEFNPIPKDLTEEKAKYILGGQANVWTEYIPSFDQVEYMVYPRAIALMQSLWCQNKPDYDVFLETYLNFHEDYLALHSVNFAKSIHIPKLDIKRTKMGVSYAWEGLDSNEYFDLADSYNGEMGGLFTIQSGEEVEFDRGRGVRDLMLEFNNDQQITYRVELSDVLGAAVEMNPKPHRKYDHNGSLNLVDGTLGSIPWKGDQWLGFNEKKISLKVDLGEEKSLESLSIGFLNQNGSWIYLPESYSIQYSKDGKEWFVHSEHEVNSDEIIVRPETKLEIEAKYILITVQPLAQIPAGKGGAGSIPWTFIDEIQIFTK